MILFAVLCLAIGWFIASAVDKRYFKKDVDMIEGEILARMLNGGSSYETLRQNQKAIAYRPRRGHIDNGSYVDEPRDRGDGARVLQIDKRRKMQ